MTRCKASVRHPIFARIYQRVSGVAEAKGAAGHRDELLAGLRGRVIEAGAGNGLNFGHYPPEVSEVVAIEPEAYLRARAEERAAGAPVPVRVVDGVADELPAEDAAFDAGVASLLLCSVPDQATALAEFRRVIRPDGELRFYEHVVADRSGLARAQQAADVVWPFLAGGCHTSRDTAAAIERAGFTIETCRRFPFRPFRGEALTAPRILGCARRR